MQPEVSTTHAELKQNIVKLQEMLSTQIENVQAATSTALKNTIKTLTDTKDLKEAARDTASKVGKVNDAADKIATTTQSYRDALAQSPAAIDKNRLDPKVLQCKADFSNLSVGVLILSVWPSSQNLGRKVGRKHQF